MLLWLLAGVAAGQVPGTVFREQVDVALVEVEVRVTDRQGRPVTDLEVGDFRLFVDGKRRKIAQFARWDRTGRAAARPAEQAPQPPPEEAALPLPEDPSEPAFLVIFVDQRHISPLHRNALFPELGEFLNQRERLGDRMMVVSFDRRLRVEQPFSADAEGTRAALERLLRQPTGAGPQTGEQRAAVKNLANLHRLWGCALKDQMVAAAEQHAAWIQAGVESALRSLGETVNSLAGLPGSRAVLYLSDGLPLQAGAELFQLIDEWCPFGGGAAEGVPAPSQAFAHAGTFSAAEVLGQLTAHANRNRVTIHTLQSSGLPLLSASEVDSPILEEMNGFQRSTFRSHVLDQVVRGNRQETLHALAADTGGRALLDVGDVADRLQGVASDLDAYYSLAYRSPLPTSADDRSDHRIEVKVRRPGVVVRHRRTQAALSRAERRANRTLSALWYRLDHNDLAVQLLMSDAEPLGEDRFRLPVLLRLPIDRVQLIPDGDRFRGRLDLFFVAEDARGRKPPPQHLTVPVTLTPEQYLNAVGRRLDHAVPVELPAGRSRLAVGVWDDVGGAYSVLYRELQLPQADAAAGPNR